MDELTKPTTVHGTIIISALTNLITSTQFIDYDTLTVFAGRTFNEVLTWIAEGRGFLDGFASRVTFKLR
jgi:hypothetical protein